VPRGDRRNRQLREAARGRILDGSVAAFAEKGFRAASMDDVARAAGVSKGLAYFYFRSKEALLACVLEERIAHLFDVVRGLDPHAPARERLTQLVGALFSRVIREPELFRLHLSLTLERSLSGVATRSLRRVARSHDTYLAAVRDLCADLGSADPDLDALLLRSALLGVFLRYVRAIEDVPLDRLCSRLLELFGGPARMPTRAAARKSRRS